MTSQRKFVRLFQPRFAPLVEDGTKRQTIRPIPVRMPVAGDLIDCRAWTGRPYNSPQRILLVSPIIHVDSVVIGAARCECAGYRVTDLDSFAKDDGFQGWMDMRSWFLQNHDLGGADFHGILIHW